MSVVYISPLDDILKTPDEKKALLLGVAAYLKKLNAFASVKKTPNLTEYNVGGVISIVEQLETLADTYKTIDGEVNSYLQEDDYFKLLVESWFCYEDCKVDVTQAKLRNYFNEDFDQSGTLAGTLGDFILTLEPAINRIKYEMFKVSHKLLNRYSNYLVDGDSQETEGVSETKAELTKTESENIQGLLRSFKTLFKLQRVSNLTDAQKSIELRKTGNELFRSNSTHAAIAKYTEALAFDPKNVALLSNRAAVYQLANDPDHAIEDLTRAVEIDPSYEAAWTRLGFAYLTIGESLKSIEAYSRSIKLASDSKRVAQYIKRLVIALENSEKRARSNGVSETDISQYTDPIQEIRRSTPNDDAPSDGSHSNLNPQGQTTGVARSAAADAGGRNVGDNTGTNNSNNTNSNGNGINGISPLLQMFGMNNNGDNTPGTPPNVVNTLNTLGNAVLGTETVQGYLSNLQQGANTNNTNSEQRDRAQHESNQQHNGPQNQNQNQTHAHNHQNGVPQNIQEALMNSLPQHLQGSLGNLLGSIIGGGTVVDQGTIMVTIDQDGNPTVSHEAGSGNQTSASANANTNNQTNHHDDSDDEMDPADFDLD